jgi:hypothetical protein
MATLNPPYWQAISPVMQRMLVHFGQQPFADRFYLAGGTALALQLGHRRSVDFDFFSETDEVDEKSRREILRSLSTASPQVIENVGGNLLLLVDDVRVGFFGYGYSLVSPSTKLENVPLASIADIGLMKCDALISRGSRKDFYDLYFILRYMRLDQLLQLGVKKYPLFRDFPLMVMESMTLFDNADRDTQPDLLVYIAWEEVKQFFIFQAGLLGAHWFILEG